MKRPIKFRGRDINTGEVIFGDLRHIGIRTYIFKEAQCYYDEELIEVDEDSVAQLVGYDADGREVYEGDELADNRAKLTGDKVTAVLQPYIRHTKNNFGETSLAEHFDRFWNRPLIEDWQVKLKEA